MTQDLTDLTPEEEAAALQQLKDELRKRDELITQLTEEKETAINKLRAQLEEERGGRGGSYALTPRPPGGRHVPASPRKQGSGQTFRLNDLEASKPRSPRTKLPVLPTHKAQYTPNPRTPSTSRGPHPPPGGHGNGSMSARGPVPGGMSDEERAARHEELRQMESELDYLRIEQTGERDSGGEDGPRDVTAWKQDENLDKWWKEVIQRKAEMRAKQMKKVKKDMKWIEKMKQKQKQRQKAKEKEEKHMAAEEAKRKQIGWRARGLASSGNKGGGGGGGGDEGEQPRASLQPATQDEPLKWQLVSELPPGKKREGSQELRVWCRPGLFKTFTISK